MSGSLLLSSQTRNSEQEWRLLSSLYGQNLSLAEGSTALFVVETICFFRTGSPIFIGIAIATLLSLASRLLLSACYWHFNSAGQGSRRGFATIWAGRFVLGAAVTSLLWGLTDLCVILGFRDETLQLFVLLVQTGWLGGVVIRNAVSPTVIYCQVISSILPAFIAIAMSGYNFMHVVLPFLILQIFSTFRTARALQANMVQLMESEQRLANANVDLFHLSETDDLTGIANRRALESRLKVIEALAEREEINVSVLMIDIDHFKLYNDYYGHQEGDKALKAVAMCLTDIIRRPADLAVRYGGEEFAVLLPNTNEDGAGYIGELIRSRVEQLDLLSPSSPLGQLTVSLGLASFVLSRAHGSTELFLQADRALYIAKSAGRNRLCGAGYDSMGEPSDREASDVAEQVLSGTKLLPA